MSEIKQALPATGPYVERLVRIFRDRPDDDGSAVVLQDYARSSLSSAAVAERGPDSDRSFLLRNAVTRVSELEAENARLKARLAEAMEAIDRLLAPFEGEECWRDHHGYCQTHFLEEDCSVNAARCVREGGKVDG